MQNKNKNPKIAIIISTEDPAAITIAEQIELMKNKLPQHVSIHTVEEQPILVNRLDKTIDADLFIFATKHSSAAGVPSLTVHHPGNWFANDLGGEKQTLSIAPALYLAEGLLKLEEANQKQNLNLQIVQECTHHGPMFEKPTMFIEIGSSQEQYKNKEYGKIIAETILYLVTENIEKNRHKKKVVFGIGGTHYTPSFKKLILNENYAFGHVCPKYQMEHLTKEMLQQALEKTVPAVEEVVIDWKGVGSYKDKVRELILFLEEKKIAVKKI